MAAKFYDLHGVRVLECAKADPPLRTDRDAAAIMEHGFAQEARVIVIPASSLDPDFFQLQTRVAGEMLQKFLNYGFKVAIIGDFTDVAAHSDSLQAFIYESNRGDAVWFLSEMGELEERLARS